MNMKTFYPIGSFQKTATTSSAVYSLGVGMSDEKEVRVVRQHNSSRAWIKFGSDPNLSVSSTTGIELISLVVEFFDIPSNQNNFAIICDTGTVDINLTVGVSRSE